MKQLTIIIEYINNGYIIKYVPNLYVGTGTILALCSDHQLPCS